MKTRRKGWGASALFLLVVAVPVFSRAEAEAKTGGTDRLSKDLVTLTVMRNENASQPVRQDSVVLQYLEKKLNVQIKIEATPDAS